MRKFINSFNSFCNKSYDNFMTFFRKHILLIVFIVLTIIAFVCRILFFQYLSGDMNSFLIPWFNFFKSNGHLHALSIMDQCPNNDYFYGYNTLLAILSYLDGTPVNIIKSISLVFDFALACGIALIVYHFHKSKAFALVAYLVILFCPSVFANSAVWGQCDQIYTCFVVYFVYFILKNKPHLATLILGVSFGFKIQTIFILPVVVFLWLNKKYRLWYLLLIPFGFFLTIIPSYIFGAAFKDPFLVFGKQLGSYANMNYGSGSIYAFMEMGYLKECFNKGTAILLAFSAIAFALFVLFYKKVIYTKENFILICAFFAILTPFVLPHMHERYFFMADILIILYVLVYKKHYYLAALMVFSSVNSYTNFLTREYIFKFLGQDSVRLSALINLFIVIVLIKEITKLFQNKQENLINKTN